MREINWQLVHELLLAEMKRLADGTSVYQESKKFTYDELNRMNDIVVPLVEKQS